MAQRAARAARRHERRGRNERRRDERRGDERRGDERRGWNERRGGRAQWRNEWRRRGTVGGAGVHQDIQAAALRGYDGGGRGVFVTVAKGSAGGAINFYVQAPAGSTPAGYLYLEYAALLFRAAGGAIECRSLLPGCVSVTGVERAGLTQLTFVSMLTVGGCTFPRQLMDGFNMNQAFRDRDRHGSDAAGNQSGEQVFEGVLLGSRFGRRAW
jgi:hypothetical protein